ncbi:hypothetical protein [Agrobacterium pusense]|uniref:hypothetical protein n=1 Tax=Agrobacterium pusense TaxID=648995 RepID=UPI003FCF1EEE
MIEGSLTQNVADAAKEIKGPEFLDGVGVMPEHFRADDWAETELGRAEDWPVALKTLVEVMLGSSQPMFVTWGGDRTLLYNDAYAKILGRQTPCGIGQRFP